MRRVIVAAWDKDTKVYAGRRLTLYREPTITFGNKPVGGIRISAMSHLSEPLKDKFQTKRGVREEFVIQPLPDAPTTTTPAPALDPETERAIADLRAEWSAADPERKTAIEAEVARLQGQS